jgi:hypothetical protein
MTGDLSVVGCTGQVIVATRGDAGMGEVQVGIRGGTETFMAWSEEPLAKGTAIIVVDVRGARTVDVRRFAGLDPFA